MPLAFPSLWSPVYSVSIKHSPWRYCFSSITAGLADRARLLGLYRRISRVPSRTFAQLRVLLPWSWMGEACPPFQQISTTENDGSNASCAALAVSDSAASPPWYEETYQYTRVVVAVETHTLLPLRLVESQQLQ